MSTRATVREAAFSTAELFGVSIKKEQLETIENFVCGRDVFLSVAYWIVLLVSSWSIQQTLSSEQKSLLYIIIMLV